MSKGPYRYTAYRLAIDSEIALPELRTGDSDAIADVTIRRGSVAADGFDGATQIGPFLRSSPRALWLEVPKVARFLIEDGDTITVDAAPGIDDASVRVFLLGSAFGALLFQRKWLVLHGNAVAIDDACLVCVGPSGAGKSTLAAALVQRGHALLADDVVPINGEGNALPGQARIKLWRDAAQHLKVDTTPLNRVRPQLEKFNLPAAQAISDRALPLRWVYILQQHPRDTFVFEPIRGMHRLAPLRANTYRNRFLAGMQLQAHHLQQCASLANRIRLVRVTRPSQGFRLNELADRILEDARAHA